MVKWGCGKVCESKAGVAYRLEKVPQEPKEARTRQGGKHSDPEPGRGDRRKTANASTAGSAKSSRP